MADERDVVRRENEGGEERGGRSWLGIIIRFVVAAIVLMITAAVTPGFKAMGFGTAVIAALIIALLDYAVQRIFKVDASPFGRGLTGFIVAAIIIYVVKFIVPGYDVTFWGAVLGALIYGIINLLIPGRTM